MITWKRIVIHCTDTRDGREVTPRELDMWHAERCLKKELSPRLELNIAVYNPQYPYVGYHDLVQVSGTHVRLRAENELGSHAGGHNHDSFGIVLAGQAAYSRAAWAALKKRVEDLLAGYPSIDDVVGHRDLNPAKTCPGFSVEEWIRHNMEPLAGHILGGA